MAFWMAAAMLGSSLLSYGADSASAKAQKKIQDYKNKMTNISAALSQNSITTNTILTQQQSKRQDIAIQQGELGALGTTAVSAAAAGVRGNSVKQSLIDVQRNAAKANFARQEDLRQAMMQYDQQRQSVALQAVMGQDVSYIPKPSLGSYLLGATANYMDTTEGSKNFSKWFGS